MWGNIHETQLCHAFQNYLSHILPNYIFRKHETYILKDMLDTLWSYRKENLLLKDLRM
jgi:hypothetical protein